MGRFRDLGVKIDNWLVDVETWNRHRIWYKPFDHIRTVRMIKKGEVIQDRERFIEISEMMVKHGRLWNWQAKLLIRTYDKHTEGR